MRGDVLREYKALNRHSFLCSCCQTRVVFPPDSCARCGWIDDNINQNGWSILNKKFLAKERESWLIKTGAIPTEPERKPNVIRPLDWVVIGGLIGYLLTAARLIEYILPSQ